MIGAKKNIITSVNTFKLYLLKQVNVFDNLFSFVDIRTACVLTLARFEDIS